MSETAAKKMREKIAIIGGGAWGQAIASLAYQAAWEQMASASDISDERQLIGREIAVYSKRAATVEQVTQNYASAPHSALGITCWGSSNLAEVLRGSSVLVIAIPAQEVRRFCVENGHFLRYAIKEAAGELAIIIASKGLELESGELLHSVISQSLLRDNAETAVERYAEVENGVDSAKTEDSLAFSLAVLSGPNFADEVSQGLPAVATLACDNLQKLREITNYFAHSSYKIELSTDLIGVQVAGAFKNIVAIASGMASALGLGLNFQAALVSKGLREMASLIQAFGGQGDTVYTAAGIGDLILTACNEKSRNMQFGQQYIMEIKDKNDKNSLYRIGGAPNNVGSVVAQNSGGGVVMENAKSEDMLKYGQELGEGLLSSEQAAGTRVFPGDDGGNGKLAEGRASALALARLTQRFGLALPIAETVYRVLYAQEQLGVELIARWFVDAVCSES